MNLHLAVLDLFWPDRSAPSTADVRRLPALEQLFAKGRRTRAPASHLQAWLLDTWRASGGAAAYALTADGGEPGAAWWARADPCHLRVNNDRLVPIDAALLDISRAEAEALVESLNAHFGDAGHVFYPMQPERWYLRSEALPDIEQGPLAVTRGKPVDLHGAVRRTAWAGLANEAQMLLHEHPVNETRSERGALPINAIWLSGGGRFTAPAGKPFRRVRTRDPLAAGLARASGAGVFPLPETAERWLRASGDEGVELLILDALSAPASYEDVANWREQLVALERDWFAPLLEALRSGRIGMLTLHAIGADGTIDVETTRQDLRYFWRRSKPIPSYAAR
jgi:hypothetical protein